MEIDTDILFMRMAVRQAQQAYEQGEVPIGAVLVHENTLIGKAYNQVELLKDPTAHAEMLVITQGAAALSDWRLEGCTLYVTKEPCPMCAGAIVNSRIQKVVWGVSDPKRGGAISVFNILQSDCLNHRAEVQEGVMEQESKELLQRFFRELRRGEHPNGMTPESL